MEAKGAYLFETYAFTVAERFLRYVQIDTQSDPFATSFPSTAKQKVLGRLLVKELEEVGLQQVEMDDYGYVYATLPANTEKKVPVLCFCSHMDTSPDCSGREVKPLVHRNYDGRSIRLPDAPGLFIDPNQHPDLKNQEGNDIITASGKTLLGADDKSGLAIIMDAMHYLKRHPEIPHGKIRVLFTPDEEIGRGTDFVDLNKLGADFGYTLDGDVLGTYEDENFNADKATVTIEGVAAHPGSAKGRLINALKVAAALLEALPKDRLSPETTAGKQGFIHPVHMQGNAERVEMGFILRDFTPDGLQQLGSVLRQLLDRVLADNLGAVGELHIAQQYRNMHQVIARHPQVSEYALQAIEDAGIPLRYNYIRGGTDGAMLSFKGLPCPNLFTGQHAFHSKEEWISIQDMQKAVEVVVRLCNIWAERS